ncbi:hypothetical protein [Pseudomonas sp. BGI-2]|uniref:hypothetical protein n=1 Tax=Pseudomonas sp. BGI-2 TaxID=2528211 RepID=UPI00103363DE|nr:hypothetical protein [Pseudomonas sp. BGI-2]TBN37934.1 hypothetical protein EYC95_22485 [Pseudomonas sp. BGI-2]
MSASETQYAYMLHYMLEKLPYFYLKTKAHFNGDYSFKEDRVEPCSPEFVAVQNKLCELKSISSESAELYDKLIEMIVSMLEYQFNASHPDEDRIRECVTLADVARYANGFANVNKFTTQAG